jgi:hypothetical protein
VIHTGDVGLGGTIEALDLIERAITIGGRVLDEGVITMSTDGETTVAGLPVERWDLFALDVTQTTLVAGTTVATASLVFDGSDTGFDDNTEDLFAVDLFGVPDLATGNSAPVAVDDTAITTTVKPVVIDVLANDSDADFDPLTVVAVVDGSNGTVVDNGDGTVTYRSGPTFSGVDTFAYRISDGNGSTDTGLVTVSVDPAFVVNSTEDTADDTPGDGLCDTGANNTAGEIRRAIPSARCGPRSRRPTPGLGPTRSTCTYRRRSSATPAGCGPSRRTSHRSTRSRRP